MALLAVLMSKPGGFLTLFTAQWTVGSNNLMGLRTFQTQAAITHQPPRLPQTPNPPPPHPPANPAPTQPPPPTATPAPTQNPNPPHRRPCPYPPPQSFYTVTYSRITDDTLVPVQCIRPYDTL